MIEFNYNYFKKNKIRLANAIDGGQFANEKKHLEQRNSQLKAALQDLNTVQKNKENLKNGITGSEWICAEDFRSELNEVDNEILLVEKHFKALKKNFRESESSESLTKQDHLSKLEKCCINAKEKVDTLYRNMKKRLRASSLENCELPGRIESTIIPTEHNKKKLSDYKKLYNDYEILFGELTTDNFSTERVYVENKSREIQKLRTEFDEDYPNFVEKFLNQTRVGPVSLDLITVELLKWLRENDLIEKYAVTAVKKND